MKKLCLFLLLPLLALPVAAGGTLYVPEKAPYTKGLMVRENIKNECNLERRLADYIAVNASRVYDNVVREKPTGNYHVLEVEIMSVFGAGGGAWSGPKNVEIKGVLKDQGGKVVGDFYAERFSTGGALGSIKGTCGILKRIVKVLGKDVSRFLANPSKGVRMGN